MLRRPTATLVAVAAALLFVAVTGLVASGSVHGLDHSVHQWVHDHHVAWLARAATVVTDVLSPTVDTALLVVSALILAARRQRLEPALVAGVMLAITTAVILICKHAVHQPAPSTAESNATGTYPSGHTAATLVFLGTVVLLTTMPGRRRTWMLVGVAGATALCAAALVYAGFHWLTDTIGSIAFGVAMIAALVRVRGTAPP